MNPSPILGWRVWSVLRQPDGPPRLSSLLAHAHPLPWGERVWEPGRPFTASPYMQGGHALSTTVGVGVYAWGDRADAENYLSTAYRDAYARRAIARGILARGALWVIGQVRLYGEIRTCSDPLDSPRRGAVELAGQVGWPVSIDSYAPHAHPLGDGLLDELRRLYLQGDPSPAAITDALAAAGEPMPEWECQPIGQSIPSLAALVDACRLGSGIHGDNHARAVARNILVLNQYGSPANVSVGVAFAAIHDAERVNEGHDPDHGPRAAELARRLQDTGVLDFAAWELDLLVEACRIHTTSGPVAHPTIGACLDGDRLDLGRVGITPDPRYMSTPQAAPLCPWPNLNPGCLAVRTAPPSWAQLYSTARIATNPIGHRLAAIAAFSS